MYVKYQTKQKQKIIIIKCTLNKLICDVRNMNYLQFFIKCFNKQTNKQLLDNYKQSGVKENDFNQKKNELLFVCELMLIFF